MGSLGRANDPRGVGCKLTIIDLGKYKLLNLVFLLEILLINISFVFRKKLDGRLF